MSKMASPRSRVLRGKLKEGVRFQPYRVAVDNKKKREACRIYDLIYATIYGHVIGDALGLLTETLTRDHAKKLYQKVSGKLELVHKKMLQDSHRAKWEVYDWTDESDAMILILQSLVAHRGEVDPRDFAKRLMAWCDHGFVELGDSAGHGLAGIERNVVFHPQFSEKPHKAAEIVWRNQQRQCVTNGAVTRTSVLGIHYYNELAKVIRNSLDICTATHADPRCQASCVAVATALAFILQRDPKHLKKSGELDVDAIMAESFRYASQCLHTLPSSEVKELKHHMFAASLRELRLDEPGMTNHTYKALGAGFWALRQKDFRQAIEDVVMEGGDADANGAVAGALLGCKLGLDAIPSSWIRELRHRPWLDAILDRYLDMMEGGRFKPKRESTV